MKIGEMFSKDIDRPISGVIKVSRDDGENIHQELEEYVVTTEINKHLGKFYENYLKSIDGHTDKIGVWISGFFGSGKSHFLKILSYLLENKEINSKKSIDYFDDKIEDPLLLEDIRRATVPHTEVILFNIDAKSPISGKTDEETLLKIFLKMFHNHQGFYGDSPGIAYMEKFLTEEGKYEAFKDEFRKISGHEWEDRRRAFHFIRDDVVKALSAATGMSEESAREWHKTGVKDFDMDIQGFAREVKEYLDSKGESARLVFLVDEVGQYIGDNATLMLNLQTIAEELGTQCNGRAWLIVTSQEGLDELTDNIKNDDFSKIQGRFDTRLLLTSLSVDQVIKKRILEKKDYVDERLRQIYLEKSAVLRNLINFEDARSDLVGYKDEFEFAAVYPFIPYQFKLLQSVFENIRTKGSTGKHLSEGERSMLSAYKESASRYKDAEEGTLIPFAAFYDTIYEFLNPSITRVIDGAAKNPALEGDDFTLALLKVLFMIKYVDQLPATVDNLAVLMADHMDIDKRKLKNRVTESLSLLSREYLIEKNGDVYEFLTDDEQDINRDIKQTKVDETVVKRELREYIFNQLYHSPKYRYSPSYDFDYKKRMDEVDYSGREVGNMGIHVLSPLSDSYNVSETTLLLQSADTGEMIVRLDDTEDYIEELSEILKVIKYTKNIDLERVSDTKRRIIESKRDGERTRRKRVTDALESSLKNGDFYINGEKIQVRGSSVKEIMDGAMKILTESVYTKLSYIKDCIKNPEELNDILARDSEQMTMDGGPYNKNDLAIEEVYEYISLERELNKQVRVKPLIDYFRDKPYGWNELDILGIILTLLKEQRINLRYQGEYLTAASENIVKIIIRTSEQNSIIVSIREKVDEELLRRVKAIALELWNTTNTSDDEDGLVKDIRDLIDGQIRELESYINRYEGKKYPGKPLLEKGLEYYVGLNEVVDTPSFFKELVKMEEDLIIWEEDMAYIRGFFKNQKDLFDKGLDAKKLYEDNRDYLEDETLKDAYESLREILEDPLPYGKIKDIPEYISIINEGFTKILNEKRQESLHQVEQDLETLNLLSDHPGVSDRTKEEYRIAYQGLEDTIESRHEILSIMGVIVRSENLRVQYERKINNEIESYKTVEDEPIGTRGVEETRTTKRVRLRDLTVIKSLKSSNDVELFLNELERTLKQLLEENDIELMD